MSITVHLDKISLVLEKILISIAVTILAVLAVIIITSVFTRYFGASLYWADEVASNLLAWLTFYGSAYCALKRSHMGFGGLVASMSLVYRKLLFILSEVIVIVFFVTMAWAGYYLLDIYGDETLTSLTWIPLKFTQSALPIGGALFVAAQICSMPKAWNLVINGTTAEDEEIKDAIRDAKKEMAEVMETVK
jgi:TRAP-type C4-dicarboxylate transport system permease small subunit